MYWLGHYARRDRVMMSAMGGTIDGKRKDGRKMFQLVNNIKNEGRHYLTKIRGRPV